VLRSLIETQIEEKCKAVGADYTEIADNTNLYSEGIIDSFDVVEILTAIEEETGISADMTEDEGAEFVISINWFLERFAEKKL
tara:strand:- start:322 stop:570 length:249 start_codon:yes stop_codon:yes gene_type:complete